MSGFDLIEFQVNVRHELELLAERDGIIQGNRPSINSTLEELKSRLSSAQPVVVDQNETVRNAPIEANPTPASTLEELKRRLSSAQPVVVDQNGAVFPVPNENKMMVEPSRWYGGPSGDLGKIHRFEQEETVLRRLLEEEKTSTAPNQPRIALLSELVDKAFYQLQAARQQHQEELEQDALEQQQRRAKEANALLQELLQLDPENTLVTTIQESHRPSPVSTMAKARAEGIMLAQAVNSFSSSESLSTEAIQDARIAASQRKAEELLKTPIVRTKLCAILRTASNDAFDIAKIITPVLATLATTGALPVPFLPIVVASTSMLLARMGIASICGESPIKQEDE